MTHLFERRRNRGAGQDELPQFVPVISLEANSIPQFGGDLPFVQQARRVALEKFFGRKLGQCKVLLNLLRIVHVKDTPGDLFGCCGLSTPFCAFDQHRTLALQFPGKKRINDTRSVLFHMASNSSVDFLTNTIASKNLLSSTKSASWQDFVRQLGKILFGNLARFRSATWQDSVRHVDKKTFGKLAEDYIYT